MIGLNDMRWIIAKDPDSVRRILLTRQQSEVFRFVRKRNRVTASLVAHKFRLSAQHASMVMGRLHDKGYVDRISTQQPSGGYEYEYSSKINC